MVVQMAKYLGERMAACSAVLWADETVCALVDLSDEGPAAKMAVHWEAMWEG